MIKICFRYSFAKFTRIDERDNNLLNLTLSRTDEVDDLSASIGYYTEDWSVVAFGRNDELSQRMYVYGHSLIAGSFLAFLLGVIGFLY